MVCVFVVFVCLRCVFVFVFVFVRVMFVWCVLCMIYCVMLYGSFVLCVCVRV